MAMAIGRGVVSKRLLLAGIALAILLDLDVIAFRLGIPYADDFGHRGFSHSLLFAAGAALAGALVHRGLDATFHRALWFLFAAIVSHSLLDAFTNGGLGVALLWPWSDERFFAPLNSSKSRPLTRHASFLHAAWRCSGRRFPGYDCRA